MDFDKLEDELKNFDYTYMMSDDFRVYSNGKNMEKEVREMIKEAKKIDKVKTINLIKKYKQQYGTQF